MGKMVKEVIWLLGQTLEEYIEKKYGNNEHWFEKETDNQQERINKVVARRHYLKGNHKINAKKNFIWKSKTFETKKTKLDNVNDICDFQAEYLIGNKPSLNGAENTKLKYYNKFFNKGSYHRFDNDVVKKGLRFDDVGEYVYREKRNGVKFAKSYIIEPEDFYPVYSETMDYVGAIEHWIVNNISYYRVYYDDRIEFWDNEGGDLTFRNEVKSETGLPIHWRFESDYNNLVEIMDTIEKLVNRLGDSVETIVLNPILYNTGRQIDSDEAQMDSEGVGYLFNTLGGKLEYAIANMDYNTIKLYLQFWIEQFYTKGGIPSIVYGQTNIANVSEVSLKLLYQLADTKAKRNEMCYREGLEQRFEKWDILLRNDKVKFNEDEDVNAEITYMRPQNDTELIDNLYKQWQMKSIPTLDIIEKSPLTNNVNQTKERIIKQYGNIFELNKNNKGLKDKNKAIIGDDTKEKIV